MKILYITNPFDTACHSGGYISDYLNDLLFYGLTELDIEVVDSTPIFSIYSEYKSWIHPKNLWGGFTAFNLIDWDSNIDLRGNWVEKIKNKYFDLIIYGNIRRCADYYDIASTVYPTTKIIFIDGNDDTDIIQTKHPYFKRELIKSTPNVFPISFAFPTCKLTQSNHNKQKHFATCIPNKPETYIFKNEQSYYQDYQDSFYGYTQKKAGWDCMRHYEILGNYCVPFFDLSNCPEQTLYNFPKKLIKNLQPPMSKSKYYDLADELFKYTSENLTTKALAEYVLSTCL